MPLFCVCQSPRRKLSTIKMHFYRWWAIFCSSPLNTMVDGFSIHVSFFTSHICAMFISPLPFIYHSLNLSLPLPNQKDMQNHLSMQIRPMALHEEAGLSCGERNERGKKWRNDNYIFFLSAAFEQRKRLIFSPRVFICCFQTKHKVNNRID